METSFAYRSHRVDSSDVWLATTEIRELIKASYGLATYAAMAAMIALPAWSQSVMYRGFIPTLVGSLMVWLRQHARVSAALRLLPAEAAHGKDERSCSPQKLTQKTRCHCRDRRPLENQCTQAAA